MRLKIQLEFEAKIGYINAGPMIFVFKSICIPEKKVSVYRNGTVERTWRTLFDMTRCLLLDSRLPKFFADVCAEDLYVYT